MSLAAMTNPLQGLQGLLGVSPASAAQLPAQAAPPASNSAKSVATVGDITFIKEKLDIIEKKIEQGFASMMITSGRVDTPDTVAVPSISSALGKTGGGRKKRRKTRRALRKRS